MAVFIKSLAVKGFRSLADVKLDLGDLTVLIGPNNAGKTNTLDLLRFISEAAEGGLNEGVHSRGGLSPLLFADRAGQRAEEISVELEVETLVHQVLPSSLRKPLRYGFALKPARAGFWIAREESAGRDLRAPIAQPRLIAEVDAVARGRGAPGPAAKGHRRALSKAAIEAALRRRKEAGGLYSKAAIEAFMRRRRLEGGAVLSKAAIEAALRRRKEASESGRTPAVAQAAGPPDELELAVSQPHRLAPFAPKTVTVEARVLGWLLSGWGHYGYPLLDTRLQAPVRLPQVVRPEVVPAPDGSNLASVLYTLQSTEEHSVAYNEVCTTLSAAFPEFQELRFPPEGGDGRILLRWLEKGQKYGRSSFDLSDGTLNFLLLTALLHSPDLPRVTCIDEPEVGLHPGLIRLVAEALQAASEGTQLIVATHSPILVDGLKPEQVVIVEKGEDPATQFRTLDQEDLKEWLKEFSLGELWLTGHLGSRAWGRSPFTWRATLTRRFFGGCFTISPQP